MSRWDTSPIKVEIDGEVITLREACKKAGRPFSTAWRRIKNGWSARDAIFNGPGYKPGTKLTHARGYSRLSGKERRSEHILIAEKAIGKPMPAGAEVHHVNYDRADNRPENLVVCQDHAYHMLLHRRQRALEACGDANKLKCEICHEWDYPDLMYIRKKKTGQWHKSCGNKLSTERKRAKRKSQ